MSPYSDAILANNSRHRNRERLSFLISLYYIIFAIVYKYHSYNMYINKNRKRKSVTNIIRIIFFIFLICLPLTSKAQSKQNKVAQLIHRVDSLRLKLRGAADEGRMLQWADSLVRQYTKNGKIDTSLVKKLSKIDRTLFWETPYGSQLPQNKI